MIRHTPSRGEPLEPWRGCLVWHPAPMDLKMRAVQPDEDMMDTGRLAARLRGARAVEGASTDEAAGVVGTLVDSAMPLGHRQPSQPPPPSADRDRVLAAARARLNEVEAIQAARRGIGSSLPLPSPDPASPDGPMAGGSPPTADDSTAGATSPTAASGAELERALASERAAVLESERLALLLSRAEDERRSALADNQALRDSLSVLRGQLDSADRLLAEACARIESLELEVQLASEPPDATRIGDDRGDPSEAGMPAWAELLARAADIRRATREGP